MITKGKAGYIFLIDAGCYIACVDYDVPLIYPNSFKIDGENIEEIARAFGFNFEATTIGMTKSGKSYKAYRDLLVQSMLDDYCDASNVKVTSLQVESEGNFCYVEITLTTNDDRTFVDKLTYSGRYLVGWVDDN